MKLDTKFARYAFLANTHPEKQTEAESEEMEALQTDIQAALIQHKAVLQGVAELLDGLVNKLDDAAIWWIDIDEIEEAARRIRIALGEPVSQPVPEPA